MANLKRRMFLKALAVLPLSTVVAVAADEKSPNDPLVMVVMDPLSAPLSCPCVKGYAQRDYEKLAKFLSEKLGRPVKVHFGESLTNTLQKKSGGKADIIIGKESVVRHEAKDNKLGMAPIAALTGKDGKTTMTGLIVVAGLDPAVTAGDLKGYKIIFGGPECDEKFAAPQALLKELGVEVAAKPETCAACSDGAVKVIEAFKKNEKMATVISSYAQPLLEGCGTIQKGDLKVIGKTEEVPFVTAFVNEALGEQVRSSVRKALLEVGADEALKAALETKEGFVALKSKKK